jgi:hypothetical protein
MFWREIGTNVTKFLSKTFEQGILDQHFNKGLLSLIPKLGPRTCINNYRPKSVFTSRYKIVIKVLAYCLQPLIPNCIKATQTWLVKKKHILENVFVAIETM